MQLCMENLQTAFFENVKAKLPASQLMAHEIARILSISKAEAYNKIKGSSGLTLHQLEILCKAFDCHFEINPPADKVSSRFTFTPFHTGKIDMLQYVTGLNKQVKTLVNNGLQKLSCSTDDIPFFHLFKYPELTAFKLFFWNTRISAATAQKAAPAFSSKSKDKKSIAAAYTLYGLYQDIPSLEIWNNSDTLIILEQMRYAFANNLVTDKKLMQAICDQLMLVLHDIEGYAINKTKNKDGQATFDWHYCEVVSNVSYLATLENSQACFLRFNTFNNLESGDNNICNEVNTWLQSLLKESVGFSGQGSNMRNKYLLSLRQQIEMLQN